MALQLFAGDETVSEDVVNHCAGALGRHFFAQSKDSWVDVLAWHDSAQGQTTTQTGIVRAYIPIREDPDGFRLVASLPNRPDGSAMDQLLGQDRNQAWQRLRSIGTIQSSTPSVPP